MKSEFFTGLDLGQSCDYTAMAVGGADGGAWAV